MINELHSLLSLDDKRLPADEGEATALLNQIALVSNWQSIRRLAPYILHSQDAIARCAVKTIVTIMNRLRSTTLLQLDDSMRRAMWSVPMYNRWQNLNLSDLEKSLGDQLCTHVTGLVSFHNSGFKRAEALKRLGRIFDGHELPYLLIRLTDWVPQVAQIAESAVEKRLTADYLPHFVANLPILDRISQRARGSGPHRRKDAIIKAIDNLLQLQHRKILLTGFEHKDHEVRRICLRLLAEPAQSDLQKVLACAIQDKDLITRRETIRLSRRLEVVERIDFLKRLLSDSSFSVRREALREICQIETNNEEKREYLFMGLLDNSSSVREYARWQLRQTEPEFDCRHFYLEQLSKPDSQSEKGIQAVIAGLGDCGDISDSNLVLQYTGHHTARVRATAIETLGTLNREHHADHFMKLLDSDIPAVSRAAANQLGKTNKLDGQALSNLLSSSQSSHVRRNVVRLLNLLLKWDRISYLLLAATHEDGRVRNMALGQLRRWGNQHGANWLMTMPNDQQKRRIASSIATVESELPLHLKHILRESIG